MTTTPPGSFHSIWEVVSCIPRGRVATYGQIARMAGLLNGARTVGWALQALPDGLKIRGRGVPWHRVINAQGRISLTDSGREMGGLRRQAVRLRREGIEVSSAGALDLEYYRWSGERVRCRGRRA